jgi:hypothetical protein
VKLAGVSAINPVNGEEIPISSPTTCHELRYGGHYGGARPRRAGLGLRQSLSIFPSWRWSRGATWRWPPTATATPAYW